MHASDTLTHIIPNSTKWIQTLFRFHIPFDLFVFNPSINQHDFVFTMSFRQMHPSHTHTTHLMYQMDFNNFPSAKLNVVRT